MQQRHWYNDREVFWHGLARSNYVTALTDWFMSFAGKWAELVLYGTVLYSCAELYPGVHLPAGLSLTVFLVQLGALDIGGLSLAKLAKQARADGNAAGATNAERLSKWLIGIMLVGVVTVGLEHALPVTLPSWVITTIDVLLVVARSICAVLYGRVVHDLKQEMVHMMPIADAQANISELTERFTKHLQSIEANLHRTLTTRITESEQRFSERLSETLQSLERTVTERIEQLSTDQMQPSDLAQLTALPETIERQLRGLVQEVKVALEASTIRPRLSLVERAPNTSESGIDKAAFVRSCLTEHPEMRNSEIQRKASEQGVNISPAYISELRKAFLEEQSA